MSSDKVPIDAQEMLQRLLREGSLENRETTVVASPGARVAAWTIKVVSNHSYNVYNVRTVVVGEPGTIPVEIGQQTLATNMAESFLQQGQLPGGTYAIMFRVGDKNAFYATE